MSATAQFPAGDHAASATGADPRYPAGRFARPETVTAQDRQEAMATLARFPEQLRTAVQDLSEDQVDTPYREGGWTVRQLVHHLADSHAQAFARYKLGLTEDWPTIKPYDEKAWAELADNAAPVAWSLNIIQAVHGRWDMLLHTVTPEQFSTRGFNHPERGRMSLEQNLLLYAWHSRHHLAHITQLRAARGW